MGFDMGWVVGWRLSLLAHKSRQLLYSKRQILSVGLFRNALAKVSDVSGPVV
ncbi:MAG: hypothetical protein ACI85J_001674 [Candidatus Poriferisodalaceae bacterium]|jgi:hypothetical protein